MTIEASLELCFPVVFRKGIITGYHIAAAIKHTLSHIGKSCLADRFVGNKLIGIALENGQKPDQQSQLIVRLDAASIDIFLMLTGRRLDFPEGCLLLGTPFVQSLHPALELASAFVTIKGFQNEDGLLDAARRQVNSFGIGDVVLSTLYTHKDANRRVITIKRKKIVGFSIVAKCSSSYQSIALQSLGIGGRRHFGAGMLFPYDRVTFPRHSVESRSLLRYAV